MSRMGSFHIHGVLSPFNITLLSFFMMNFLNSRLKDILFFLKGGGGGCSLMTKMKFSDDIHMFVDFLSSVTTFTENNDMKCS